MYRDSEQLTKTSHILLYMLAAGSVVESLLLMGKMRRYLYPEFERYKADRRLEATIHRLFKQGWLKVEYKESKRILKLTQKGELEALFQKANIRQKETIWDGKWRMVVFDIPEHTRQIRFQLRKLLKGFGFKALQASVYVYPFALNKEAIMFLKSSGLLRYTRFARIDAFDDDLDLRKKFKHLISKKSGRQ